jgi:copper(I)-binding protein
VLLEFEMMRYVLFAATLVLAHSPAWAAGFKTGNVIIDPAVRATPGGAKVGAGYLTIRTTGSAPTV